MSRTERLTDSDERAVAAAEADLSRLLSVEPSVDFAARVRARISESHEPRRQWWGWAALAVASAAVLVLVLIGRTGVGSSNVASTPAAGHPDVVLKPASSRIPDAPVAVVVPSPHVIPRPLVQPTRHVEEPEVLIDPSVAAAIRRLAIAVRNTSLDATRAETLQIEVGNPSELVVSELPSIPELVLKPADQTGGQ
jgi:hypothetical protein